MERNIRRAGLAIALGCLANTVAWAHGGSTTAAAAEGLTWAHSLLLGMQHPWSGLDHLLALLCMGLWSARGRHRVWVLPLAAANVMLLGALLGMAGIAPPVLEPLLAISLVVMGGLLASQTAVAYRLAGAMVLGFALLHGMAHGQEFGAKASLALPLGMLLSSLVIMAAGVMGAMALRARHPRWQRLGAGGVALVGGALLTQVL